MVGVDTNPRKSSTTRGYGAEKVSIELRHAGSSTLLTPMMMESAWYHVHSFSHGLSLSSMSALVATFLNIEAKQHHQAANENQGDQTSDC